MKAKFRDEWANLGRRPPPKTAVPPIRLIRILDLPGFQNIEDKRTLTQPLKGSFTPDFEDAVDVLSNKTFGITMADTEYKFPDDYWYIHDEDPQKWEINRAWDRHERQFLSNSLPYDEKAAYLKKIGWDFTDRTGNLLHVTELFCRQAEAVSRGIAGHMPDIATVGLDDWAAQIERDVRAFKKGGRANRTTQKY